MQLVPPSTGISSDISRLIKAVAGLTVSYKRLLTLSNGHISQENQELDQIGVDAI